MQSIPEISTKIHTRVRKFLWRLSHDCRPDSAPIFVVGVQRSGTSMLMKCLEHSPELLCLSEKRASVAYTDFRLHGDDVIRGLIADCPYRAIAFKPLTDSHRVSGLLELAPNAKVVWLYRRAADRANSAVKKFGAHNLNLLTAFKKGEELNRWQAQGLSEESLKLIRQLDYSEMTPESAAAIFWYIRNSLFFEQGLDSRHDVMLVAYEELVSSPSRTLSRICDFIGISYEDRIAKDVHMRSVGKRHSKVSSEIEVICEEMYQRFEDLRLKQEGR